MKLSKRFLFVPVVLIALSYLFYSAYKDVKDRTLNEFNIQQFTLAKQASRGIESFFILYQRELLFLSKIKSVSDLTEQGKELLRDFYTSHSDQIEAITIVDSHGILLYTYPLNNEAIGKDISNQPHIKTVIETNKPTVSDVFTSVQGFRAIAYHIPISTDKGYKGSIAILIPIDKLGKRFIENIRTGETGYGWMLSEQGIELYNPSESQTGKPVNEIFRNSPSVLQLIGRSLKETEGSAVCNIGPDNEINKAPVKILTSFYRVTLGNAFWTIFIFTPEKEVFAKLTSFRDRLYILILLIILVLSTYFYLSFKASNVLKEEKKRKAIQKTLLESEKRFRVMFELSPAGIILIDEKGKIIEVNSSFCETLGYSGSEVLGKNIRMFASPDNDGDIERNISKILSGKTMIHEVTNIKKDGTPCVIALYETMIILPDGKQGILSVSNDITEKKRSQERMLTLSRALESIGECVSITDLHNNVIFVNNAFCNTYGYNADEIIGSDISIIRSPAVSKTITEEIFAETAESGWFGELINVKKDGTEFPIELSTSNIRDEKGNPIAQIGIAVDITDRKRAQQELIDAKEKAEESDRLKSTFLTNMSHELRTPLNAIIGFSGLMSDSGPDEETPKYAQIILKSGQHLLSLVEDIFDITMIETGQIKINNEKLDAVAVLKEIRDIIQGESISENKSGVGLILNLDGARNKRELVTDRRKLKQVLLNLMRNALKFTDEGHIEIGYTVINNAGYNSFQFYVKDTGIGIDKNYHDAIFNLFRQIDDTHTRKFGGMGIGLSIAKKTVELLGGKIWVESQPGEGSEFLFTIPDLPGQDQTQSNTENYIINMENDYSGKTILIAEDEQSNFDFLKILLTRMNFKVLWAKNGREAVDMCEGNSAIDLVLMDIKMPELNGYEATRIIKKWRPDLPVIAQTAYAMIADKIEADKAGCDAYLSKPIRINQLKEAIENLLKPDCHKDRS